MIRHVLAFSFRPAVPDADREGLLAELAELPAHYPAMRRFAIGPNISRRDDTFEHAFSVEFESEAELVAYLDSERHETFVAQRFRPLVERRVIVSFEA
jgi:hypothetical protein